MAKTVFITGTSSGIGLATVKYFTNKNWNVVATMRDPQYADSFFNKESIFVVELDVGNEDLIKQAIKLGIEKFGKIDVVVNNAGIGCFQKSDSRMSENLDHIVGTNLMGLIRVTDQFIPILTKQSSSSIINISSVVGRVSVPLMGLYVMSKHAVSGYSQSIAPELSNLGIKVKVVEPGVTKSKFYKSAMRDKDEYFNQKVNKLISKIPVSDPEKVAKVIFNAANSKSFRVFYPVGIMAYLSIYSSMLTPSRLMNYCYSKLLRLANFQ